MKDYSFGNYICALRKGLGLSQFQLGTLVGVTDKAVSKWENGDAVPRTKICRQLADILGVSVNELLSCQKNTSRARKELDLMNCKLWEEAYDKLGELCQNTPVIYLSRLASEEVALKNTDAIQCFALVGLLTKEARKQNTTILPRGDFSSSLTAWIFGASEINPLPAHYFCPACGAVEIIHNTNCMDLPPKNCHCGTPLRREGFDIPYHNFARAQKMQSCVEISVSENFLPTAKTILQQFYEEAAQVLPLKIWGENKAWCVERYVITSKKKALPIPDADGFYHFDHHDYWTWQENETTFTFIVTEMLNEIHSLWESTGIAPPAPAECWNTQTADALCKVRTAQSNIPLPADTSCSFASLLRFDGFLHGSNCWKENGEILYAQGVAELDQIPAFREDVYNAIVTASNQGGLPSNDFAQHVMLCTYKGRYARFGIPDSAEKILLRIGLPQWFPEYLRKVLYLFPKGHCIAFLLKELTLQWYRLHS